MARSWSPEKRQEWERLAQDNAIIVDLGSRRSIDMTYTLDADLYIGDVSSQVYEYLVRPRPCLFVNAHSVDWERNEDYAMWRLGEVVSPDCDVAASIDRAFARHSSFRPHQMERIGNTLHGVAWDAAGAIDFASVSPIARAADIAEAFTHRRFAAAFSPVLA